MAGKKPNHNDDSNKNQQKGKNETEGRGSNDSIDEVEDNQSNRKYFSNCVATHML